MHLRMIICIRYFHFFIFPCTLCNSKLTQKGVGAYTLYEINIWDEENRCFPSSGKCWIVVEKIWDVHCKNKFSQVCILLKRTEFKIFKKIISIFCWSLTQWYVGIFGRTLQFVIYVLPMLWRPMLVRKTAIVQQHFLEKYLNLALLACVRIFINLCDCVLI